MNVNLDEVELGLVVNLKTLREVLKGLRMDGRSWWIASDPHDAAANGFLSIGYGDPQCKDRLNTLHFRVPVIGNETSRAGTDRLLLVFDPYSSIPEEPGFYLENDHVMQDPLEDFLCFYEPIKRALIARLLAGS